MEPQTFSSTATFSLCPTCRSTDLQRVRRNRRDKLRGIKAKYRCHECGDRFEIMKSRPKIFNDLRKGLNKLLV